MIWISRGRGGWAVWIPIICLIGLVLCDEQLHMLPADRHASAIVFGVVAMLCGMAVAALGFSWNRGPGFWTIDSATGLRYFDKSAKHSLFFIPMQYWGLVYCAIVILIAVLSRKG
jgi:hypothetical protein